MKTDGAAAAISLGKRMVSGAFQPDGTRRGACAFSREAPPDLPQPILRGLAPPGKPLLAHTPRQRQKPKAKE